MSSLSLSSSVKSKTMVSSWWSLEEGGAGGFLLVLLEVADAE